MALAAICATALSGCAGSATLPLHPEPGFYVGTMTLANNPPFAGQSGRMIAEVMANGNVEAHAWGQAMSADLVTDGESANLITLGTIIQGAFVESVGPGGFTFQVASDGVAWASGTLAPGHLPSLGTNIGRPAAGTYKGEVLVESNGRAVGLGTATATFEADGTSFINVSTGTPFLGSALFTGTFAANGSISDSVMLNNGSVVTQVSPQFSNDGSTVTVRFDQLLLEPGRAWITLHPTVASP